MSKSLGNFDSPCCRLNWRKSQFSGGPQTSCVEAAAGSGAVFVRDTKNRSGGTLDFRSNNWATFITELSTDRPSGGL